MKKKLVLIYHKLSSRFGRQHWWPAESPFEVMVGAILTQGTSWMNVEKAVNNLKKNELLIPEKLRKLSVRRLAALIKSAGYYNIKALRIKNFLNFLFKYYRDNLKSMRLADTQVLRQQFLGVKGIGPETADSVLLYALDKPVFVIDAYTKRILLRHHFIREKATYNEVQNLFMQNLKKDVKLFNEYHALLVRLGKDFCLKSKPKCRLCPLNGQ